MTFDEIKLVLGHGTVERLEASVEAAFEAARGTAASPDADMALRQLLLRLLANMISAPSNHLIADRLVEHCCVELHNLVSEAQYNYAQYSRH